MKNLTGYYFFLIIILIQVLLPEAISAKEYAPEDMPNVQLTDRREYISDPDHLLSESTRNRVNAMLMDLRRKTSAEVVVAIPSEIGDTDIETWSEKLFTSWGIGKKDVDNGILIVISPESRKARIQTGYGTEGALPDISCANIIGRAIIPNMRDDNLDAAVEQSVEMVSGALTDPAVAEEIRSSEADNYSGNIDTLSPEVILNFIYFVAGCILLAGIFIFCRRLLRSRHLPDNYDKAMLWRDSIRTFILITIFSAGTALPLLLLAIFLYRNFRTRPRLCSTCGAKMKRLDEEHDNELLSASQDFEEKLDTIDYDVWECPSCGTIERYAFKKKQQRYQECPACHTVAMRLASTRTITPATTRHSGLGAKIYECEFCHHRKQENYVIPKKEDGAALAAGLAAGAMSGRGGNGGFGGGGFGGGFGGGATGGGGASGGW